MLDVAIICSSFPARIRLLNYSLQTWLHSGLYSDLAYKIFVYENGWEGIPEPSTGYPIDGDFEHFQQVVVQERAGSHLTGYNYWLARVQAKVYLFTHPDLLFPADTVRVAYETAQDDVAAMFKVFWIPEEMTNELYKYDWRRPETLENELAPYPLYSADHGDFYWNKDVRDKTEWHSTTTWAVNNRTLQKLLPFPDFGKQGPDDPYFFAARSRLGIQDVCVMNPILFHQWHPQSWNGDSQEAVRLASEEIQRREST